MEIVLSIIGTLCVCYLLHRLSIKKHGVENDTGVAGSCASEHEESGNDDPFSEKRCRELCLETLRELNCKVHINDLDIFEFAFQGYRFSIMSGGGFIRIWLLDWHEIDLDDIDMLARARRLINEMNTDDPLPCLTYFISEEEHKMFIRATTDTLFIREIPDTERYLANNLEWFFPKVFDFKNKIAQEEKVRVKQ